MRYAHGAQTHIRKDSYIQKISKSALRKKTKLRTNPALVYFMYLFGRGSTQDFTHSREMLYHLAEFFIPSFGLHKPQMCKTHLKPMCPGKAPWEAVREGRSGSVQLYNTYGYRLLTLYNSSFPVLFSVTKSYCSQKASIRLHMLRACVCVWMCVWARALFSLHSPSPKAVLYQEPR